MQAIVLKYNEEVGSRKEALAAASAELAKVQSLPRFTSSACLTCILEGPETCRRASMEQADGSLESCISFEESLAVCL